MLGYLLKDDASVMAHDGAAKKRVKRKQKKSKPALPNDSVKNVAPEEHKPKERETDPAAGTAISLWIDPAVPPPPAAPEWNPRPPCSVCATAWHWGKMESQKIEHGDGEDRSFAWRYRCMPCVKREQNLQTDG